MKSNRLGCFTPIAIFSALITLGVIAGIAYARGNGMFSPGPLNAEAGSIFSADRIPMMLASSATTKTTPNSAKVSDASNTSRRGK